MIYAIWWHKPLDIDSPTLLEGEEAWKIAALMCVSSQVKDRWSHFIALLLKRRSLWYSDIEGTELGTGMKYGDGIIHSWTDILDGRYRARLHRHRFEPRLILCRDEIVDGATYEEPVGHKILTCDQAQGPNAESRSLLTTRISIKKGQSLSNCRCLDVYTEADYFRTLRISEEVPSWWKRFWATRHDLDSQGLVYTRETMRLDKQTITAAADLGRECVLEPSDVRRWRLVSSAWRKYGLGSHTRTIGLQNPVQDRLGNWPYAPNRGLIWSNTEFQIQTIMVGIAGALYGGLHHLAWNAVFPSQIIQLLWRSSGLAVVFALIWGLILNVYLALCEFVLPWKEDAEFRESQITHRGWILFELQKFAIGFARHIASMIAICGCIGWVIGRVFLVVEACMQVARLPPAVYELPDWSKYYPHIG